MHALKKHHSEQCCNRATARYENVFEVFFLVSHRWGISVGKARILNAYSEVYFLEG